MITVLVALLAGSLGVLMASMFGANAIAKDRRDLYERMQIETDKAYSRGFEAGLDVFVNEQPSAVNHGD